MLCFANFYKYVPSKKNHLQQFGIIHSSNLDVTYFRNVRENKIMFVLFHLLKTYIRNSSLLFTPFHLCGNNNANREPPTVFP
jgi:hypothetical protein